MVNTFTKRVALFVAVVAFATALPLAQSYAEETDTLESLRARIAELETLVTTLKADLATAQGEVKTVQTELELARTLFLGAEGDDVKSLQEWLAQYQDIYPEGIVSGYYGPLTEKAVKRFQQKYGIEQVGTVGPQTRERIRVMMAEGASIDGVPKGLAKKVTLADDDDDDDGTTDLYELTGKGKTVLCHKGKTITVAVSALMAQVRNGARAGACEVEDAEDEDEDLEDEDEDEEEDEDGDDEDVDALEIDDVDSDNVTDDSADIVWTTNNDADSLVWYSLEEDVYADDDKMSESDSELVKDHSLELTDLDDNTEYFYFVVSVDENDVTATSSVASFTTE